MGYKYIFGPVPSRRLGISLGIDLIPFKTCTLNCVYCECGVTNNLTLLRKEYVPTIDVINELKDYLENNQIPDYVTFSGSGEPTLHSGIGDIVKFIKSNYPNVKLALLTNGTLLNKVKVKEEVIECDVVLPSLDAATKEDFIKINRPHGRLDIDQIIHGLTDFKKEFKGKMLLEIFFAEGINTDDENIFALRKAIKKIKPDEVQLNSLDRPPAEDYVKLVPMDELYKIKDKLNLKNVYIIKKFQNRKDIRAYRDDIENTIIETIRRRPLTLEDLSQVLGLHINELNKYLDVLEHEGRIESIIGERGVFIKERK
ncbi:radical SAM protein [bacterium]|nr:radical SAM protein [bacterium]